mmetsp:Transcript_51482/g.104773  ORF Transcript_51482/g.104773 Transcript_51482/m.104773 type:complete len:232 (+) Transcript_51482:603-1298(+)
MKRLPAEGLLYYFNYLKVEHRHPAGATLTGLWRFLTGRMGHAEPPPDIFESVQNAARERTKKREEESRQWDIQLKILRQSRSDRDKRGLHCTGSDSDDDPPVPQGYREWVEENFGEPGDFTNRVRSEIGGEDRDRPRGEGPRDLARWLHETAAMAHEDGGSQELAKRLETAADLADKLAYLSLANQHERCEAARAEAEGFFELPFLGGDDEEVEGQQLWEYELLDLATEGY